MSRDCTQVGGGEYKNNQSSSCFSKSFTYPWDIHILAKIRQSFNGRLHYQNAVGFTNLHLLALMLAIVDVELLCELIILFNVSGSRDIAVLFAPDQDHHHATGHVPALFLPILTITDRKAGYVPCQCSS